ncbi:thioesterase domain-containing protein [Bradyrhizobium sp. STM 3843]|uniref:thioesterase domain-containing protein n=1 Tax=Bradyrhizobium sp. STM 3843 TaxID=551947 RepID=UPI000A07510C|nr:thioesterase domain-containing protein [Bradyrhizobium sp. STM 3843]
MQSSSNAHSRAAVTPGFSSPEPHDIPFTDVIRATGTRPALFGVFPAPPGGREFVDMLPLDQPVYDLYFSKLSSDASFPTTEQLAIDFLRDIRKIQAHGPYQILGYSNAGLLAYEVARLLTEQGEEVTLLALIDTWHPEFVRNLPKPQLIKYRGMRYLDRLKKYARFLRSGRVDDLLGGLQEFLGKRVKGLVWRLNGLLFRRANQPAPASMKNIEVNSVLSGFSPRPYAKRFLLIRPDDPVDKKLKDKTVGWHVCATAGVEVQFLQAEHGQMMNRPQVRVVMDEIIPRLAGSPGS